MNPPSPPLKGGPTLDLYYKKLKPIFSLKINVYKDVIFCV